MRNKMAIVAGAVAAGLLITGVAFAAQDSSDPTGNVVDDSGLASASEATSTTVRSSSTASNGTAATTPTSPVSNGSGNNSTSTTNTTATTNTTSGTNTTATTSPTSTTNTTGGSSLPSGSVTYDLDGAGTVTVNFANGGMTIGSVNPAAGWIVDKSEQSSNEIEVELKLGEAEVELNLHITGGQLVVQIIRS